MTIWSNRPPVSDKPAPGAVPVEYRSLHKYLDTRFADTVVLTFAEIEDLLGFTLPPPARLEPQWWADRSGDRPVQSLSWTEASRTATVNLSARTVAFARTASPITGSR